MNNQNNKTTPSLQGEKLNSASPNLRTSLASLYSKNSKGFNMVPESKDKRYTSLSEWLEGYAIDSMANWTPDKVN